MNTDTATADVDLFALFDGPADPDGLAALDAERAESAAYAAACRRARADYVAANRCGKCCGTGELPHFRHVADGVCFACEGAGVDPLAPAYTPPTR